MRGSFGSRIFRDGRKIECKFAALVATGAFSADAGRVLRRASDLRIVADYDEAAVQTDRARNTVDAMEKFISAAAAVRMERKP